MTEQIVQEKRAAFLVCMWARIYKGEAALSELFIKNRLSGSLHSNPKGARSEAVTEIP
jgi:hypothetical protein